MNSFICTLLAFVIFEALTSTGLLASDIKNESIKKSISTIPGKTMLTAAPNIITTNDNELDELSKSSITTKIYRSNDPALDLIEGSSEINTTSFSDLINKDELLKNKNSKIIERKITKNEFKRRVSFIEQLKRLILPWFITFVLAVVLALIFKYVVKRAWSTGGR